MRWSRLTRWVACVGMVAVAVGLGVQPVAPAPDALAQGVTRLRLGMLGSASDAGIFIAQDLGYFRELGLELDVSRFDSAARMVAPLGAGQLDIGAGSHSAGLFNAVARGIAIKLVADKGSALPGHGFQALVFRRDLVESGRLRSPADLRGMRIALSARGVSSEVALSVWLQRAGLSINDVEIAELNFADHASALGSGAIEASVTIEPFLTFVTDLGVGTIYQRTDELIPGQQIAEIIYGGQFIDTQAEAARRFMVAYIRGVRYYNDAFGRGDPAKRQEVVNILIRNTPVKDAALYDRMTMPGLNPDGRVNVASLEQDQEVFLASGLQQQRININDLVDHRFVDAVVQELGPYR